MNNQDFNEICKFLQREEAQITNELINYLNVQQIVNRFDELDMLELISLKIRQQHLKELEQKLLAVCYHLTRFGGD